MLANLAETHPKVRETFIQASTVLGYDLWQLAQEGPKDSLNQTDRTQPAMLTAGTAIWLSWRAMGGKVPDFMAGHSLGEYTAWVCAGAFGFRATVALVADRARYMLEAVPQNEGAMVAILGLSDEIVKNICQQASQDQIVEAANFNAPGQVVIAGHVSAINRAVEYACRAGAKTVTLPVSVPAHCSLMKPAAVRLNQRLSEFAIEAPIIPVVNNVDVAINSDPNTIRSALVRQLDHPVRWVETLLWLKSQGVDTMIECGPGKVLTGLTRRIEKT